MSMILSEKELPRELRNRIPRAIATCSCGLKTHIEFVKPDDKPESGRYEATNPHWQFRTESGPENLPVGWYCGKEGHHAADYTELSALPFPSSAESLPTRCACETYECCPICCTGDHAAHVKAFDAVPTKGNQAT